MIRRPPRSTLFLHDALPISLDHRWTMVTSIDYVPGAFTMYDVYTSAPYNYLANGYLDPPKIPQTPGGTLSAVYAIGYFYNGEVVSQITHNDALAVKYSYDGLGRVLNVTGSLGYGTYLARLSYYPNDQVKGVQFGNGLIANYTYDKDSRSSQIKLKNETITYLLLNYQYYNTGIVASVTGQSKTQTGSNLAISESYKYDSVGRLTNSTTATGSTITGLWYQYDALGNRAVQGLNSSATGYRWITTTYGYNPTNNELLNSTSRGVTTRYGYNPNGGLSTKNVNSTHWTYAWDVQGDLLSVGNDSGVQGYYAYDGLGRRVEMKEGSSLLYYAYQGTETMFEHTTSGADVDYAFANGLRIAKVTGYGGASPTVVYYHTDALGNTRLITGSSRNVIFSDSYQPYGQDNGTPTGSETYKFTGKPVSQTTGLYYEYQRWYDPSIGRFISADPVAGYLSDPQSLNPYVYTENLPTGFIDPSGTDDCSINPLSWLGCASNAWNTLSPEEQQGLLLAGFVALTWATGGTDLLFVGGIFALGGVGLYTDVTYAEGGTPTIAGALGAANLGFGLGTGVYAFGDLLDTGLSIGTLSQGERLAANRAAGLAFEGRIADAFDLTRNIGPGRLAVQGIETAGSAVPDFATGILGEAKYSNYVSLTRQIKILIEAASKTDTKELFLFTREDTRVSSNLWLWAAKYRITLYKIPWV